VYYISIDRLRDVLVTAAARRLSDLVIEVRDANIVRVQTGSEIEGVEKSVRSLYRVLPD
jgi:hypothetical protein